ncbi:unnamed protein product [Rotaria sordida]|uniref:CBM21 domain-containing protein n=1 Tax=Rotaria sordida TaxID=392033 RepID=A0A818V5H0_9BILA|nr:unnamed protein product [Rotaria sordida]
MSRKTLATNGNKDVDAPFLSSNHKVMQYLQSSAQCSTNTNNNYHNCNNNNPLVGQHKTSSHGHDIFYVKDSSMNNNHNQYQHRMHSSSENTPTPSTIDTSSRFSFSYGSSLSDPGGHCSILSSNTSSSGICSTFSDVGQEEGTSTSSEDLDFNLGFDQISDNDDIEVANLDEIDEYDEYEQNEEDNQRISNKNSDAITLLDFGDSNSDAHINGLEGFLRKSYSSATLNGNVEFNNDDTITDNQIKQQQQQQCVSLLHDSTYTLCSPDRFSMYTENDDHEKDKALHTIGTRSKSLGITLFDRKSALLEQPPKKVVRFADMLGLDLESIRYMTPPDQSANSLIQECIRIKLEQLRLAKSQSNLLSSSPCHFDLSNILHRSSSSSSVNTSKKSTKQYCLISKYFTSPTNIIPLIYERQVMLECLHTKDSIAYGTVRVHNRTYEKRVFARISGNDWETFQDIQGWHSMTYPNDNTDTFTIEIRLEKYDDDTKVPKQIYFAICLEANSQELWDDNFGRNYVLDVVER